MQQGILIRPSKFSQSTSNKLILPGTSKDTLNHLIDHELDLAAFDDCSENLSPCPSTFYLIEAEE